jgi:hypothetical protein
MPWRVVRAVVALALAAAGWSWLAAPYNTLLAHATQPLVRFDPRLSGADVTARSEAIAVDSPRGAFPEVVVPASQLTYNVILLVALFASNIKPLRDRNVIGFFVSLAIVMLLHPLGTLISIESTYATRLGAWSEAHYGNFAANFWLLAEMFWRLVGMFGVVFAAWWVASTRAAIASKRA